MSGREYMIGRDVDDDGTPVATYTCSECAAVVRVRMEPIVRVPREEVPDAAEWKLSLGKASLARDDHDNLHARRSLWGKVHAGFHDACFQFLAETRTALHEVHALACRSLRERHLPEFVLDAERVKALEEGLADLGHGFPLPARSAGPDSAPAAGSPAKNTPAAGGLYTQDGEEA